jgi:hypothetical protein
MNWITYSPVQVTLLYILYNNWWHKIILIIVDNTVIYWCYVVWWFIQYMYILWGKSAIFEGEHFCFPVPKIKFNHDPDKEVK